MWLLGLHMVNISGFTWGNLHSVSYMGESHPSIVVCCLLIGVKLRSVTSGDLLCTHHRVDLNRGGGHTVTWLYNLMGPL